MIWIALVITVVIYVALDVLDEQYNNSITRLLKYISFLLIIGTCLVALFSCKPQQSMLKAEKKQYVNVSCPTYPAVKHKVPEWWIKFWNPDKCPQKKGIIY